MIPLKLQQEGFRFIKVRSKNKIPVEAGWQREKNYKHDSEELKKHIDAGGNYGVATGFGDLVVIDSDYSKTQEFVEKNLPETFRVSTGKGIHNYYICKDLKEKIVLANDSEGNHYGEVQTVGQQVVAAGSTHPNGHKYEVINDCSIKEVSKQDIEKALKDLMIKSNKKKVAGATTASAAGADVTVGIGNRNNSCFTFALTYRRQGFEQTQVLELIKTWNSNLQNPLSQQEIETTVKSAFNRDLFEQQLGEDAETISLLLQKKRAEATERLAKEFLEKNKVFCIRDDKIEEFWIYKDGFYNPNGKTYINEFCRSALGVAYTVYLANEVSQKIAAENYISPQEFFTTNYVEEICLENGIFNTRTKKLSAWTSDKIFFSKMPIKYMSGLGCPNILKFLDSLFVDKNDIKRVQELIGYCLHKELFLEKAFMFIGKTRNGKSKLLELIRLFLGEENFSTLSLQQITKEKFLLGELFQKMSNIAGDISSKQLDNIDIFKGITGRDKVLADRKYKTPISFVPFAKLLFSCNILPEPDEAQDSFFERWEVINFPYTFFPQHKIDIIDESKREMIKLENPNIIKNIISEEEMSGLLNWSLIGLERLKENKKFTNSQNTNEIKKIWLRGCNSIVAFLQDEIIEDEDSHILQDEFISSYSKYCRTHKVEVQSKKKIVKQLILTYGVGESRPNYKKKDGTNERRFTYKGISFKEGVQMGKFSTRKDKESLEDY